MESNEMDDRDTDHRTPDHFADRILALAVDQPDGCVVMIETTEQGCGGYGRLSIDAWRTIELRLFGWPRLVPGDDEVDDAAVESLRRLGLSFDGTDWVWTQPYMAELVPVAAHAAQRAISEVWHLHPGHWTDGLVRFRLLDMSEVIAVAAGALCERCVGDCGHQGSPRLGD